MSRELLKKCLNEFNLIHDTAGIRSADICEEIEAELAKPEQAPIGYIEIKKGESLNFVLYPDKLMETGKYYIYTSPPNCAHLSIERELLKKLIDSNDDLDIGRDLYDEIIDEIEKPINYQIRNPLSDDEIKNLCHNADRPRDVLFFIDGFRAAEGKYKNNLTLK